MSCPDENTFLRYAAGQLAEDRQRDMDAHLDSCVACRKVFSSMAVTGPVGAPEVTDTAPPPPAVLNGRYRLGASLGQGGTGQVFAAEHLRTGRRCAVKFLSDAAAADPEAVERFAREARILGGLEHRGIVSILDFSEAEDGRPYLVMERLAGEDLADRLDREGGLDWPEVRRIFRQLCRALRESHAHGVLHRDLKPSNIFLTPDRDGSERAVLLDFGLAKQHVLDEPALTRTGVIMGTPAYMSPEQARGRPVDERTDVYSLTAVLYQMLTGEAPFWGSTFTDVLAQVLADPPARITAQTNSGIPAHLDAVIQVAMAKDPGARHGSVAELEHRVLDEAAPAPAASGVRSPSKTVWMMLIGVAAALAIGLGATLWHASTRPEASHARVASTGAPDAGVARAAPVPAPDAGAPARVTVLAMRPMDTAPRPRPSRPRARPRHRPRPRPMAVVESSRPRPRPLPRAMAVTPMRRKPAWALRSDPYITVRGMDGKPKQVRLSQLPPAQTAKIRIAAYMGRRDWKTCARIARKAPQTRMILYYSIHCHYMSGDLASTRRLCAKYGKRYPKLLKNIVSCRNAAVGRRFPRPRP